MSLSKYSIGAQSFNKKNTESFIHPGIQAIKAGNLHNTLYLVWSNLSLSINSVPAFANS